MIRTTNALKSLGYTTTTNAPDVRLQWHGDLLTVPLKSRGSATIDGSRGNPPSNHRRDFSASTFGH